MEYNLSFFHAIKDSGNTQFKTPSLFYNMGLKTQFGSDVSLEEAIKASYLCKFNLYVSGDITYECEKPKKRYPNYHLILSNKIWSINKKAVKRIFIKYRQELPLVVFKKNSDDEFQIYDDKGYQTVSKLNKKQYNFLNSKYSNKDKTLKQIYDESVSQFQELKDLTNGQINLFKTINKIKTNEFHIINHINKLNLSIDRIKHFEHLFLDDATRGSYSFCVKGNYKRVHHYDVSKAFACMLMKLQIPIKEGKLTTITQDEVDKITSNNHTFKYGAYRATVEGGAGNKFPYNMKNCYTHYDLKIATKLGLKITISDEPDNALIYSSDCMVSGKKMFGEYIEKLYKISKSHPHIRVVKEMMSSIWGSVCGVKKIRKVIQQDVTDIDIPENYVYTNIKWISNDTSEMEFYDMNKIYKYDIARFKCFLLSKQRLDIFDKIVGTPDYDDIVYFRNDGWYSLKKLDYPDVAEFGGIRHECDYVDLVITNMNNIDKTKV
jgi:hypothetical protein